MRFEPEDLYHSAKDVVGHEYGENKIFDEINQFCVLGNSKIEFNLVYKFSHCFLRTDFSLKMCGLYTNDYGKTKVMLLTMGFKKWYIITFAFVILKNHLKTIHMKNRHKS